MDTANRLAGALLPAGLLDPAAREALLDQAMPSLIVSADATRILWSSHAVAQRLGFPDGAGLMRAGLPRLAPGTVRLAALGAGGRMGPGGVEAGGRLERLRFNVGFRSVALTALCQAIRLADGATAVLVSLAEAQPVPASGPAFPPSPAAAPASDTAPPPAAPATHWRTLSPGARKPLRFVFALTADGRVTKIGAQLAECLDAPAAHIGGAMLADSVRAFDAEAAERLSAAIRSGETWNGIIAHWPTGDDAWIVPVEFSALPGHDRKGALSGYSGFGRCRLDLAVEMPRPPEAPLPACDTELSPAATAPEPMPEPPAREPLTPESSRPEPPAPANVVALRNGPIPHAASGGGLSMAERNAFREIARALGARFNADDEPAAPPRGEAPDMTPPPSGAPVPIAADVPAGEPPEPDRSRMPPPILDRLPMALLLLRGDAFLHANQTLLDLAGYPDLATFIAEDGHRAIFRKGTPPREREGSFDTIVLSTREGEMIPVEAHLQLVEWDGARATLIALRRAVELEQGKALRSVALDLKRVRNEAQELRAVLDTATDGVITLDEKGRILSVNSAAEALFGLDQNEVVGESFTALLHNDSHADALDYFEGLRANGVRSVLNDGRDVSGREKKGGRIPLFMTLGRISDDEPKRYCAVLRDLTAWKRAETELTEARRAAELASAKKSDFLAKVSHEIRTPLNAIIGFAEVMLEERLGPVGTERYKEYLDDIRTSGRHVISLVNDLLDLAKIEAGRMELNFAATDLNAIVSSVVAMIQPQANANRVLVRSQLAPKLPSVVADERSIRQIVINMLSNATRFTEPGGQVIVSTALLESGEAVIRIRDTGIGMTATEIEQALEPFRQVGTQRKSGGTGLGLPLTRALVEANRANFAIRSAPGEGTMIEITFPSTRVLAE